MNTRILIYIVVLVVSLIVAAAIIILVPGQHMELALALLVLPSQFAGFFLHEHELRKLDVKPDIKIGLVHYTDEASARPIDTSNLIDYDKIVFDRGNAWEYLVVKNVGKKAARNFKVRIDHRSDASDPKIGYQFSARNMPIHKITERGNTVIFYGNEGYLGVNDELVIMIEFDTSRDIGHIRPIGEHTFLCKFWADDLDPHVEHEVHVNIVEPSPHTS